MNNNLKYFNISVILPKGGKMKAKVQPFFFLTNSLKSGCT